MAPVDAQELQMVVQGVLLWNARYGTELWRKTVNISLGGVNASIASLISTTTTTTSTTTAAESASSLPLGLIIVGCGAALGAASRAAAAAAAMRGPPSPHLPPRVSDGQTRSPGLLYLRMIGYELILTCCVATCRNFRVCHAVTTIAFGDAMVRLSCWLLSSMCLLVLLLLMLLLSSKEFAFLAEWLALIIYCTEGGEKKHERSVPT